MPNWKRLVAEGWSARLETFFPLISPILWTSAATGATPDVHRVLDFQEVDPKTGAKVPISGSSRAVPAVWNVASAAGRKVGVVGWWATHPAEEVNGFFVSDRASPILFQDLPLAGAAFPAALETGVAQVVGPRRPRDARRSRALPGRPRTRDREGPRGERAPGAGPVTRSRVSPGCSPPRGFLTASRATSTTASGRTFSRSTWRGRMRSATSSPRTLRRSSSALLTRTSRTTAASSTPTTLSSTACSASGCAGRARTAPLSSSTPTTGSSGAKTGPAASRRPAGRRRRSGTGPRECWRRGAAPHGV